MPTFRPAEKTFELMFIFIVDKKIINELLTTVGGLFFREVASVTNKSILKTFIVTENYIMVIFRKLIHESVKKRRTTAIKLIPNMGCCNMLSHI